MFFSLRAALAVSLLFSLDGSTFAEPTSGGSPERLTRQRAAVVLDNRLSAADVEKLPYGEYVARSADHLIRYGTDRYGPIHQPLLVKTLDVRTRTVPESWPAEPGPWRISSANKGLSQLRGCEWLVDQSTIEVFYLLSGQRDDPKYARFADAYLRCAMEIADEKGLFWWGTHRHYDVDREEKVTTKANHHEIHINRPRWERMWRIDPEATRRELEAIWQWHVVNKQTGEHNRHGNGRRGRSFAISGGEFVYALAFRYSKTRDPDHLKAALLVADHHWQNRHPETNLVPSQSGTGRSRFDGLHSDTSTTGILCYYMLKSYELTGVETFRDQAMVYLKAYAHYGYDPATGRFHGSLRLDGTPEPGPRASEGYAASEPRGFIDLWEPRRLGYEYPIYTAQTYAYAYQLTKDPLMLDVARKWAAWIRKSPPSKGCLVQDAPYAGYAKQFSRHGTYAGKYGRTISLMIHLYALTGQKAYLDDARRLAREAVSRLYYKGLFRGHPAKPYYCSIDGVGFLLCSLLQLDAVIRRPKRVVGAKAIPLTGRAGVIGFDNW